MYFTVFRKRYFYVSLSTVLYLYLTIMFNIYRLQLIQCLETPSFYCNLSPGGFSGPQMIHWLKKYATAAVQSRTNDYKNTVNITRFGTFCLFQSSTRCRNGGQSDWPPLSPTPIMSRYHIGLFSFMRIDILGSQWDEKTQIWRKGGEGGREGERDACWALKWEGGRNERWRYIYVQIY